MEESGHKIDDRRAVLGKAAAKRENDEEKADNEDGDSNEDVCRHVEDCQKAPRVDFHLWHPGENVILFGKEWETEVYQTPATLLDCIAGNLNMGASVPQARIYVLVFTNLEAVVAVHMCKLTVELKQVSHDTFAFDFPQTFAAIEVRHVGVGGDQSLKN